MLMITKSIFVAFLLPGTEFLSLGQVRSEEASDRSLKQICAHRSIGKSFEFHTLKKVSSQSVRNFRQCVRSEYNGILFSIWKHMKNSSTYAIS